MSHVLYAPRNELMTCIRPFRVEWHMSEGTHFTPIKEVARVYGKARNLLLGERIALNIIARCSGIAYKYASNFEKNVQQYLSRN